MAADTPLADVVQHLADGATQQGFITDAERQEMLDAAARGERPDVDLSAAPPNVQAGVDQLLDRAEELTNAESRLAEEREALKDEGRDEQEQVGDLRATATELKGDLDEASVHLDIAEKAVEHADATFGDAQNLIFSATSDADWQTARDMVPGLEQETRASLHDAADQIEILHGTLPDIEGRLDTALADATVLSAEMDATDEKLARNSAESRDVATGWTVLEAQAEHVFDAQADGIGVHEQQGTYDAVEAHHGDASTQYAHGDEHAAAQAGDSSPASDGAHAEAAATE